MFSQSTRTSPRTTSRNTLTTVVGRAEANDRRPSFRLEGGTLLGREVTAVTVVSRGLACGARRLVASPHLGLGAEALVGVTLREELVGCGHVALRTIALAERPFVPVEAEPLQGVLDPGDPLFAGARAVGVLDAEHEGAALVPREHPVEERGAHAPHVELARGRGRVTDADLGHRRRF